MGNLTGLIGPYNWRMGIREKLAAGRPVKPSVDGYDVVLVAGQSNAQGAGLGALDAPNGMVHQFAGSGLTKGRILASGGRLFHQQRATGTGFGQTFGNLLAGATGRPVLLVPVARGTTGFTPIDGFSWDPDDSTAGTNLFHFATAQLRSALATHPGNRLAAVLWHQGEADVRYMGGEQYAARLDALVTGLRAVFGTAPFIVGQMSPDRMEEFGGGYPGIDAAHRATPERQPLSAFVEAPMGLFNSPEDKLHFNADGQRELGRRYFDAYRRLAAISSSLPLSAQ